MKKLALITLLIFGIYAYAQTPFDSFAPEVSKPMLKLREPEPSPDTLFCAIVSDMSNQTLLLVDVSSREIIATAPITDEINKWLSVDPLADKYPGISPYAYCGWNPVRNIDIHGDSISFYLAELFDKKAKTNVVGNTLNDLQAITGLTLCLNNGMLEYSKNEDGSAIVSHNKGSETARNHLILLIDNPQTINVGVWKKSIGNGNDIKLAPKQINAFISGARGVDSRTLGYGMTLLHESFHTDIGGSLKDNLYSTGPVVDRMNVIRQELGPTWGQRMSYMSLSSHGKSYIPFNQSAYEALNTGLLPCALFGQLFISY